MIHDLSTGLAAEDTKGEHDSHGFCRAVVYVNKYSFTHLFIQYTEQSGLGWVLIYWVAADCKSAWQVRKDSVSWTIVEGMD